jgi:putative ABC transport system permease protein
VLTYFVVRFLLLLYPLLTIQITPLWIAIGSVMGIVGGVLGALYPAWIAIRQDPVKALSYE